MAPEEPGGYQMLSLFAMSKRDYEQAMVYREKALRLAPNDYLVLYGLGTVLLNAGEPEQAIDILKRAMRMNPSKMDALSWTLAEAQLIAGDYEDAIETSNRATARQPDADDTLISLWRLHMVLLVALKKRKPRLPRCCT